LLGIISGESKTFYACSWKNCYHLLNDIYLTAFIVWSGSKFLNGNSAETNLKADFKPQFLLFFLVPLIDVSQALI
jgi:hypothetical protein